MGKDIWKPGTVIYPVPAVMVSCGTMEQKNIITVAWTGTVNSDPAMTYVSIRPERHSYGIIRETGEFVINLTTGAMARATDFCGVRSGRDHNKWTDCRLTPTPADTVKCPLIAEAPVNIECKVRQVLELGSHHIFVADVTAVHVAEKYMDEKGTFHLENAGLLAYSHGTYYSLGKALGHFGYSIRKKKGNGRKSTKGKPKTYNKKRG